MSGQGISLEKWDCRGRHRSIARLMTSWLRSLRCGCVTWAIEPVYRYFWLLSWRILLTIDFAEIPRQFSSHLPLFTVNQFNRIALGYFQFQTKLALSRFGLLKWRKYNSHTVCLYFRQHSLFAHHKWPDHQIQHIKCCFVQKLSAFCDDRKCV